MSFVQEMRWRGMIHDLMPGTEEQLNKEMTSAYVGVDPTADSLHIGHLVSIMMLKHLQLAGHRPLLLIGGATGMIGDPSGKSQERNLLDETTLRHNEDAIRNQLSRLLDFSPELPNAALVVNNYDWMKTFSFLHFIRDVGKHITVNYMMAKDSVKKRLGAESSQGMSYTEFSYQLVQGYDFLHLYRELGCKLQMGGSDQWGNITTGTELIRRIASGEAFALTCPLITKADGTKFGKTEQGNIWLDAKLTSTYQFYQFWVNTSDADAERYIKIFTLLDKETISGLVEIHAQAPHERKLQLALAKEITTWIHGQEAWESTVAASQILFGKSAPETLAKLDENTFLQVFEGVPSFEINASELEAGINIIELLATNTSIFPSKSDVRRSIKENAVSFNQVKKTNPDEIIKVDSLLNQKYLLVLKGKKNYSLIKILK